MNKNTDEEDGGDGFPAGLAVGLGAACGRKALPGGAKPRGKALRSESVASLVAPGAAGGPLAEEPDGAGSAGGSAAAGDGAAAPAAGPSAAAAAALSVQQAREFEEEKQKFVE